jgi:phosphoribosylaminoimidazole-succinocarboxamide synthase
MEAARQWENELMRNDVADENSPDSCRICENKSNEKHDKERIRRDLGGVVEAYTEVA